MKKTMNSILLVGNDGSNAEASQGAGACIARTARFKTALNNAGFAVDVCSVNSGDFSSIHRIRELLRNGEYSSIVTISPHPAEIAVLTGTKLPMWIDMNGMHPAEIHLSGEKTGVPRLKMLRMLALENSLLSRGDLFSAPSMRQICAIMGELYLLGRLDALSRNTVPAKPIQHCAVEAPLATGSVSDEFSIISTGSFNSWFDGDTLFDALQFAMKRNEHITFTATGGSVPFAEEQYNSFLARLSNSPFKERIHIAGWVSVEELERIQMKASAAVYTDIPCGETLLGARTRVLDWISRGIPVVCTEGAEISDIISSTGMGISVPGQNPEALGKAFLKLALEPETTEEIKRSQASWRRGAGDINTVFKPLIDWCMDPQVLPPAGLGKPTVPRVSTSAYKKAIFREICRVSGLGEAGKFLWSSLTEKIRKNRSS